MIDERLVYRSKHYRTVEVGEVRGEPKGDSPCYVDSKGYIPLKKQIDRAVLAGERLEAYRRGLLEEVLKSAGLSVNCPDYEGEPSIVDSPDFLPSVDYPRLYAEAVERARSEKDKRESLLKLQAEQAKSKHSDSVAEGSAQDGAASAEVAP